MPFGITCLSISEVPRIGWVSSVFLSLGIDKSYLEKLTTDFKVNYCIFKNLILTCEWQLLMEIISRRSKGNRQEIICRLFYFFVGNNYIRIYFKTCCLILADKVLHCSGNLIALDLLTLLGCTNSICTRPSTDIYKRQ